MGATDVAAALGTDRNEFLGRAQSVARRSRGAEAAIQPFASPRIEVISLPPSACSSPVLVAVATVARHFP
jgi:hypothetical protein